MGEIYDYSGELVWGNGCCAVPMLIRSLKVKEPGLRIYVDFSSRNDPILDKKNYYDDARHAHADKPAMRRHLASDSDWLAMSPKVEPIYVAERCCPYKIGGSIAHLEWKVKELRGLDGEAYCYVQARWIEHDGDTFQSWRCTGLLKGQVVETFLLPKNIDTSASSTDR